MKIDIVNKTIDIEEIRSGITLDEIIDIFMENGLENWRDYKIVRTVKQPTITLRDNPFNGYFDGKSTGGQTPLSGGYIYCTTTSPSSLKDLLDNFTSK